MVIQNRKLICNLSSACTAEAAIISDDDLGIDCVAFENLACIFVDLSDSLICSLIANSLPIVFCIVY